MNGQTKMPRTKQHTLVEYKNNIKGHDVTASLKTGEDPFQLKVDRVNKKLDVMVSTGGIKRGYEKTRDLVNSPQVQAELAELRKYLEENLEKKKKEREEREKKKVAEVAEKSLQEKKEKEEKEKKKEDWLDAFGACWEESKLKKITKRRERCEK